MLDRVVLITGGLDLDVNWQGNGRRGRARFCFRPPIFSGATHSPTLQVEFEFDLSGVQGYRQFVFIRVHMRVSNRVDSTRLDSTRLDSSVKADPYRHFHVSFILQIPVLGPTLALCAPAEVVFFETMRALE